MIGLFESAEANGRNEPYVLQTQTAFPKEAAMSAMGLDPIARRAATRFEEQEGIFLAPSRHATWWKK
jgi:hypothetical protein